MSTIPGDELIIDDPPVQTRAARRRLRDGPLAIEARDVSKTFRIPDQRIDSLKERIVRPMRTIGERELRALSGVSFDVHRGEFFGIVGRNGSGKSTLLKIMASIYRADAGRVRMAGRVAPFIELGVGFQPEMTARENVALNGVLFGLSRRHATRMLDAVLDFAELREFSDLKIKNYSSGMMVRLAFAIMVQADADIMLVDEVLAVGDAAFGQKCMDVFHRRRAAGRTIVLVTHDMATVREMCDRALVLHDGEPRFCGDPEEASLRYLRLNFGEQGIGGGASDAGQPVALAVNARLDEARLLDADGRPAANLEQGIPIRLDVRLTAARDLVRPNLSFHVRNADHVVVFTHTLRIEESVPENGEIVVGGEIDNLLVPGRYWLDLWVRDERHDDKLMIQSMRALSFVVYGTAPRHGVMSVPARLSGVVRGAP